MDNPFVSTDWLAGHLGDPKVAIVDCSWFLPAANRNPREEYRAGHIPGAISIPLPELKARLKELRQDRDIVAYCRGPYCVMAIDAVEVLRKKGFKAHRIGQGVTDLRARGWRIDSPAPNLGT